MPELVIADDRRGLIPEIVAADVRPTLRMLVDGRWTRATRTGAGIRNSGRAAETIVAELAGAIGEYALNLEGPRQAVGRGPEHREAHGRPPDRVGELAEAAGLPIEDDILEVLFNPLLRLAPAMVLARRAARPDTDIVLHSINLAVIGDHRTAVRNTLNYLWKKPHLGTRAEGLALVISGDLHAKPFELTVGLAPLRNPDSRGIVRTGLASSSCQAALSMMSR